MKANPSCSGSCARPDVSSDAVRNRREGTHNTVLGEEEIRHSRSKVEHATALEGLHLLTDITEEPEVVIHSLELDTKEGPVFMGLIVSLQDREELQRLLAPNVDLISVCSRRDLEEVQERVQRMRIVAREWPQRVRPMQENHSVPGLQEVLGRGRSTRSGAEVIEEAHRVALERNSRAAGLESAEPQREGGRFVVREPCFPR